MKKIILLCVAFLSFKTLAQDSVSAASTDGSSQAKLSTAAETRIEEPKWTFLLGERSFSADEGSNFTQTGSGLSVGVERDFGSLFGMGLDYTDFKSSDARGVGQNVNFYSGYAKFTPIRYSISTVEITGTVLAGVIDGDSVINGPNEFFYGGALGVSLSKKVGIRLDTRIAQDVKSLTSLSVVGYY